MRPAGRFAVVVRGVAAGYEAEAARERGEVRPERIGGPGLEPAQGSGRHAGHHDAGLPRPAQRPIDAVDAPDRHHVLGVAATDVDHVLVEEEGLDVFDGPDEEREVARLRASGEGRVELGHVGGRVAAGRRKEADPRALPAAQGPREAQDMVVKERLVGLHREAAAAHRDDRRFAHRETTRKPMCLSP